MSRRIVPLTLDNLDDLPTPCRHCLLWEMGPMVENQRLAADEAALAKETWLSAALLDWGSCGKIAYVAGVPAGFALFAPPGFVPRAASFPTSPVSGDAVLLMTVRVLPEWSSAGVGRMLAQAVAAELVPRGVKAIEAFGWAGPPVLDPAAGRPGRTPSMPDYSDGSCLMPADYLRSVGFKTVRQHARYPRLRMEMKSTVSWRYDVEYALERIFGTGGHRAPTPVA